MWLDFLLDPTFLLCVAVFFSPLYLKKDHLQRRDVSSLAKSLARDPYFPFLLGILFVTYLMGHGIRFFHLRTLRQKKAEQAKNHSLHAYQLINYPYLLRPLRLGERLRSRWFLLTGVVLHGYLDGMVGCLGLPSPLKYIYATMDRRYASPLTSYQGSLVHSQGVCELVVVAPLSVLLYIFFQLRHPCRDGLELLLCVLQFYTTAMYLGQEWISGARNFDLDYFYSFTPHYVVHFWFLVVFVRMICLAVPLWLGFWSFQRISNQVMFYQRHHYPRYSFLDYGTIRKVVK